MSDQLAVDPLVGVGQPPAPFDPSLTDRFFDWVRAQPVPSWLIYLAIGVITLLLVAGITWAEGSEPLGNISFVASEVALYVVYYLGLTHYLDNVAGHALRDFRPLLNLDDEGFADLHYELTTMPARGSLLAGLLGVLVTLVTLPLTPREELLGGSALRPSIVLGLLLSNFIIGIFLYHSLRQLRMVNRIHKTVTQVNLFKRAPAYAFSQLTARTGIGCLLAVTLGLPPRIGPTLFGYAALWWSPLLPLSLAALLLPLRGMQALLAQEKGRRLAEVNARLETAFARLHQQMDAADTRTVGEVKTLVDTLLVERDVLARIPTWPLSLATLAGFVSAGSLPLVIWLVQQLLGDMLHGR